MRPEFAKNISTVTYLNEGVVVSRLPWQQEAWEPSQRFQLFIIIIVVLLVFLTRTHQAILRLSNKKNATQM